MFYPKNPKRPNGQSANMAYFVAFFISFQKIIPSKWGGQGLLVAQGLLAATDLVADRSQQSRQPVPDQSPTDRQLNLLESGRGYH